MAVRSTLSFRPAMRPRSALMVSASKVVSASISSISFNWAWSSLRTTLFCQTRAWEPGRRATPAPSPRRRPVPLARHTESCFRDRRTARSASLRTAQAISASSASKSSMCGVMSSICSMWRATSVSRVKRAPGHGPQTASRRGAGWRGRPTPPRPRMIRRPAASARRWPRQRHPLLRRPGRHLLGEKDFVIVDAFQLLVRHRPPDAWNYSTVSRKYSKFFSASRSSRCPTTFASVQIVQHDIRLDCLMSERAIGEHSNTTRMPFFLD